MTSHYASEKQCLCLGEEDDEQQEEANAEFVETIAVLDGNDHGVSIESLTVLSQTGMTNKEITVDLASNAAVTSDDKCYDVLKETPQSSVNSDIIWGDDSDYRRQEDADNQRGLIACCCKAHILEQENDARWTSSNHPEDLNSIYSLHKSASSLRQSPLGIGSPSPNGAALHCETKTIFEEADMSTPETHSSDQFPIHGPNLEDATVVLKKSQHRNKGTNDNCIIKNNVVTCFQPADVESCMGVSPQQCDRESSLGSSSIVMSTCDSLALASSQSADGDSSRIFTPDAASGKGICSRARVSGQGGHASQIAGNPRRCKQDSIFSPGSTSQNDNNILIAFPHQHSNNNCSLISAGNDLSPSCEYFLDSSDIASSIRRHSQDKDTWYQRDAGPLDEEHSHPCHSSDLCNSKACQLITCRGDEGYNSSNQDKLQGDRKIQVSDAVTGHGNTLQHKPGHRVQDALQLTPDFQAFSSPARVPVKPACRQPLQPESSTSRFLLPSSYSSPDIANAEGSGLPFFNTDTDDKFHKFGDISIQARVGRLQTRLQSIGGKLDCGASDPGVSAEGTANICTTLSCSSPAIAELIHPFSQRPSIADSSTSENTGFSKTSSTGYNYMRFQRSNNNLYSRLGNAYSHNQSPRTISRFFDQRRHGSAPDVSLRKCSSCNNVDFGHCLRPTSHQGAPEADNEYDLLSESQLHQGTTSQPDYPETGDIFDSLLSVLVDKAVSEQNINKLSSTTQEENNDYKRFKDAQRKYICGDGNHTENNRSIRSGCVHKKTPPHNRPYNADISNIQVSKSTAKPCMAQIYTEAQPCLSAPVIRITTTALSGDASQSLSADTVTQTALSQTSSSPAPGTEIYSAINAPHKPRVSFINGLRRLSREKTAFLRVEQPCSNTLRTPSSATQCVEKQDEYETGRTGKRFGRENKRRLKVEFAVMDTDSDQTAHGKRSGNIGSGFLSIKDDVENDVAMLGGGGGRFRHPRVSLLGKPLNYKAHRRDVSYRRLQSRIYNFLERPKSWQSWIYHLAMFLFVLLCLTLGVLSSITEFEKLLLQYAVYLEIVMLLWIVLELGLRVWSAGCRSRYQGQSGRLRFLRRPLCIIDMILVLASVSSLIVGSTQEHFSQAVLSGLRFFQILRMVRMDRKGGTWKLLGSVVWAHRQELVTTLYIGLLGLVFSSYFVYLAEKDEPRLESSPKSQFNHTEYKPKFSNFADAIWWGVVTLCTVGYGDVVPATWGGKVIASFSAILGISFFALPAGILGSGFALKVQQQQRQKHLNRRRIPAANLIQCLWRCYAADELSMSTATWKRHLVPCPSPPSERTFKNNTSFVSRFSTRRRDRSNATGSFSRDGMQAQSPMSARHHSRRSAISTSQEEVTPVLDRSHLCLATGAGDQKYQLEPLPFRKENSVSSIGKESEEEDLSPRLTQLTEQHKRVIRVIRKIRYFVSRRKFREALRPYDVKDVIEQYSAGHIDMLARIKNLQGRLDQILGRQGSKSKDVYESKICLASRIVKVERQVEDIENKLDMLLDMYKDDRKLLLQHLNISQKGAIQVGPSHPPPPPPAPSSQFKPRPILIDKQFTSEPATPTGIGCASSPRGRLHGVKPVIQRNLSDLSQRIKKRVTYRGLYLQDPPSRAQSAANFASIQPSNFPMATAVPTAKSPDEISSTTVSETTRDGSSENIISLNDADLPLIMDTTITTEESHQRAGSSAPAGSSDSAASLYTTEETYFLSNSNLCQSLKSIQQKQMTSSPVNSPLMRVKILSTLNEQQSLESDTSQSCASSAPPTPPTNKTAADIPRTTPPSSVHQSPLIQRQRHFSGTDSSSQSQKSSPLSSRRPRKPILRLPSTLASTVASSEDFTTTETSPQSLTTSNYANSRQDIFYQTEDTSKLCNLEDESTEIAGVTNRSCRTSEL